MVRAAKAMTMQQQLFAGRAWITLNPELTRRATTAVRRCHKGNGRVVHHPPGTPVADRIMLE